MTIDDPFAALVPKRKKDEAPAPVDDPFAALAPVDDPFAALAPPIPVNVLPGVGEPTPSAALDMITKQGAIPSFLAKPEIQPTYEPPARDTGFGDAAVEGLAKGLHDIMVFPGMAFDALPDWEKEAAHAVITGARHAAAAAPGPIAPVLFSDATAEALHRAAFGPTAESQAALKGPSLASQPIDTTGGFDQRAVAEKLTYSMSQGLPSLVAGMAGGPVLAGAVAAAQALGPYYEQELQKSPNDKSGAFLRAMKGASYDGVVTGVGWKLFEFTPFRAAVAKAVDEGLKVPTTKAVLAVLGDLGVQIGGVQPLVGTVGEGYRPLLEGAAPDFSKVAEDYPAHVVGGLPIALFGAAHMALKRPEIPGARKVPAWLKEGNADDVSPFLGQALPRDNPFAELVPKEPPAPPGGSAAIDDPFAALVPGGQIEPATIHTIAGELGVDHNTPAFAAASEKITGKRHLDDMTPAELDTVGLALQSDAEAFTQPATPSLASNSGEAGLDERISPTSLPPSTQAPLAADQVSTRPEPSGSLTQRPTASPDNLTGPAITFDVSRLGGTEPTSTRKIMQGHDDLKVLADHASAKLPQIQQVLTDTFGGIPGVSAVTARVKKWDTLVKKAANRPAATIPDYLGGRIVVDTPEAMNTVLDHFQNSGAVIDQDNFMDGRTNGYRGVHLQVHLGDGTSMEIQVLPKPIADVQGPGGMHDLYDTIKRLKDKPTQTPEDVVKIEAAHAKMGEAYNGAWAKAADVWSPAAPAAERAPIPLREIEHDTALTPMGGAMPVTHALVEAEHLNASQLPDFSPNPAYPQELQPRDRTRAAAQMQVEKLANNLNPRLLSGAPDVGHGSPIIAPDGTVESGNGRALAISKAYREGLPGAQAYRDFLTQQGYQHEDMRAPVLVRVRRQPMSMAERVAFTREANHGTTMKMSAGEQAAADANAMNDNVLALHQGGDIGSSANRKFVRGFIDSAVAESDRGAMTAPDGGLSVQGRQRVEAALLARAYGDKGLVAALLEDPDNNIKGIGRSLTDIAPDWAAMRGEAAAGKISPIMDITPHLMEAVGVVRRARSEGRNIAEYVAQPDLMGGAMAPQTVRLLRYFFRGDDFSRPNAADKVTAGLRNYVVEARKSKSGPGLFGQSDVVTPEAILDHGLEREPAGTGTNAPAGGRPRGGRQNATARPVRAKGGGTSAERAPPAERPQPAPRVKSPGREIGQNAEGVTLYEDSRGVRSYVKNGVRVTEPVTMIPGRRGVGIGTNRSAHPEFLTDGEIAAGYAPAKPTYGQSNKVFTADAAARAREAIKKKLGGNQLNVGIDPELLTSGLTLAGYHIEAGARAFPDFARAMINDLGEAVRPYLKGWYNAIRDYPGFDARDMTPAHEITPEMIAGREPERAPEPAPHEPSAGQREDPALQVSGMVRQKLGTAAKITPKDLQVMAQEAYGGTLASGKVSRDDLYDALELGVNHYITVHPEWFDPRLDLDGAKAAVAKLEVLKNKIPTQSVRAGEKESFQQFSTPPDYSYAATWAADLRPDDRVLEPSAGTGSFVAHALNAKVDAVWANDLSERRADMLETFPVDGVTRENADHLNAILPKEVKPTVVLMNPPFSATAGRMGDKMVKETGANHVEQALQRLEPGGRLVAIVGKGMGPEAAAFKPWWKRINSLYDVKANLGVAGSIYSKYGTAFPTRVLVIDKVPPSGVPPVIGEAPNATALLERLNDVRNARPSVAGEQPAYQPDRGALPQGGEAVAGAEQRPSVAAGAVGPEGEGDHVQRAPAVSEPAGNVASGTGRGQLGQRGQRRPAKATPVAAGEPGRPAIRATEGGPVGEPEGGAVAAGSSESGVGDNIRPDGSGERDEPGVTPAPEIVRVTEQAVDNPADRSLTESVYEAYRPTRVKIEGARDHPTPLVQSAAMASVMPPKPTHDLAIPKKLITSGDLSSSALETIVYAGQAHDAMLPAGEGDTPKRRGYFIGDGTGVGKGREIAGIILDNWMRGRTKAVWISEKATLLEDALRDWGDLRQDKEHITPLNKFKPGDPIKLKKGIVFTTYDTLKSGEKVKAGAVEGEAAPTAQTRLKQLVDWLGPDFDGVIAFDEAHNMGNASDSKGARGTKKAAKKALAGIDLQDALPNARVVYVSATGATEINNLAYTDRLGLWGRGTAFADRNDFLTKVASGGIAAMELVARDMKALGLYTARSLSYDGVEYDRLEHKLEPHQRETYDKLAEAWQVVLNHFHEAMKASGITGEKENGDTKTLNSAAKSAILSQFWGTHQRFFNQVITAMQMPSIIRGIEKDLKEGRQAVVQLVNTNEAAQERGLNKMKEGDDLEDLDMTPRDALMQMVDGAYPTQKQESYVDDNGNEKSRAVLDSKGNPVHDPALLAKKEQLLAELGAIKVPDGPLEMLLNHFGVDKVAEVTGRKQRVVRVVDENGKTKTIVQRRPSQSKIAETSAFQQGKKPILVFSEAGGTGRSYHADMNAPSANARRSHYLAQGGWRADKAVQGFGRTHRTNQKSAPIFHLVTTDLQGQRRFISSIARRLAQLGALTRGERRTGDQGMFSMRDNLESPEARAGLSQFYRDAAANKIEGIGVHELEHGMGLKMIDPNTGNLYQNLPPMTQFLNRVLSLKIDMQNRVFEAFSERMEDAIDRAAAAGTLDTGVETYRADKIAKEGDQVVHTDAGSGAETRYIKLGVENRNHPATFDQMVKGNRLTAGRPAKFFVRSERSGKVFAVVEATDHTDSDGRIIEQYRLASPTDYQYIPRKNVEQGSNWTMIDDHGEARSAWGDEVAKTPEFDKAELHMITGAVLPIWDRLGGSPKILRLQTDAGERMLGRVIPADSVDMTLEKLGAEARQVTAEPDEIAGRILAGETAHMANGWKFKRSLVAGEPRIELVGPDMPYMRQLVRDGAYTERIDWQTRFFVPTEGAAEIIGRITADKPITQIGREGKGAEPLAQRIPKDEPGAVDARGRPLPQTVMPGMERTAEQAAKARGETIKPKATQQEPGGLFEQPKEKDDQLPLLNRGGEYSDLEREPVLQRMGVSVLGEVPEEFGPKERETIARVNAVIAKVAPGAEVRVARRLYVGKDEVHGATYSESGARMLIAWSLRSGEPEVTGRHEAIHWLRHNGLISDPEWAALKDAATRGKWAEYHEIDQTYGKLDPETRLEEAIAHEISQALTPPEHLRPIVRRVFARIRDLILKIKNIVRRAYGKDADWAEVARRFEAGEIGKRTWSDVRGQGADQAVFAHRKAKEETVTDEEPPEDKALTKWAGSINLDRIKAPEDLKNFIRDAAARNNDFAEARRGKMTIQQIREGAPDAYDAAKQLLGRGTARTLNAEQLMGVRPAVLAVSENARRALKKAYGGSDADKAEAIKAMALNDAMLAQLSGAATEAGRALRVLREIAEASQDARALKKIIEDAGGAEHIEEIALRAEDLDSPEKVSKFLRDTWRPKAMDYIIEAWINALLSGPATHVVNAMSNTLTALMSVPETAVAAGFGLLHGGPKVYSGEVAARAFGLIQGAREGALAAAKAFVTETPTGGIGKIEARRYRAIPSLRLREGAEKLKVGGVPVPFTGEIELGGKQVRIPGRLLLAGDEFFKALSRRSEINAQALHSGLDLGLKGKDLAAHVADLEQNPTEELRRQAEAYAEYQTFTNPLGKTGRAVQAFVNSHPFWKFIIPFVRTPTNIVKYSAKRTPLGLAFKDVRADIIGDNGNIAQDQALARMTVGSLIGATVVSYALQGLISGGGPDDPQKKAALRATGWQPYSIKIGHKWYSYGRIEPLATIMGIAADGTEIFKDMQDDDADWPKFAALVTGAIARNLSNKTFLAGATSAMEAWQDPVRYGARWAQQFAGTAIPTGVAQWAKSEDPYIREAHGLIDSLKARLPGGSETLPPKRDIFGEPIKRPDTLGPKILSPFTVSEDKGDKVADEMVRLDLRIPPVPWKVEGLELNAQQHDEYAQILGRSVKRVLSGLVDSDRYAQMNDAARAYLIGKMSDYTRTAMNGVFKARNPEIAAQAALRRILLARAIAGGDENLLKATGHWSAEDAAKAARAAGYDGLANMIDKGAGAPQASQKAGNEADDPFAALVPQP